MNKNKPVYADIAGVSYAIPVIGNAPPGATARGFLPMRFYTDDFEPYGQTVEGLLKWAREQRPGADDFVVETREEGS